MLVELTYNYFTVSILQQKAVICGYSKNLKPLFLGLVIDVLSN
jgi:hypothetical protein